MFEVGQKVVRTAATHLATINGMVVGQTYTISWVSNQGYSCKVVELPDTTWQTSRFAAAGEFAAGAAAEPKTIFYNRKPSVVSPTSDTMQF